MNGRWYHLSASDRGFGDEVGDLSEVISSGCERRGHRQGSRIFCVISCLSSLQFSWTPDFFFFYPHPITTKFSLKIFLALNFSLVSTWLHWWAYFHHCLVGVVTALLPLSGTPRAAFGELLLENLICHQSTEHPGVWTHSRKCAGFV